MAPKKMKPALANTEKRLAEMREKLDRIRQQDVRGKEKKVQALEMSIADLEVKVSTLRSSVESTPTPQQANTSAVRITQSTMKCEDRIFPQGLIGPGSEQYPMQIDGERLEDVHMGEPQSSLKTGSLSAPLDSAAPKPTGHLTAMRTDIASSMVELSNDRIDVWDNTGTMKVWPQAIEPTSNSDGIQDHDMGCSTDATGSEVVDLVSASGSTKENDTLAARSTNTTNSDTVEYNNVDCVQDHNTGIANAIYSQGPRPFKFSPGIQDHIMGTNVSGLQAVDGIQGLDALTTRSINTTSSLAVGPQTFNFDCYAPLEPPAPEINGPSDPLTTNSEITSGTNWHGGRESIKIGVDNGSLKDELAIKVNATLVDDETTANDWFWDGNCEVDESVYSFQLREYEPGNKPTNRTTGTTFDSESPQTNLCRQEWENARAVVAHYEQQLKDLKFKQQSLFHALSKGLNGNLKLTVAHVTAISRASQDIERIQHCIRDLSNHTKAKRCDYLTSVNEDDQRVLIEAEEQLKGAQDRLASIDSKEIGGIQTEQALIRLSKTRIDLLQKDIEARAQEVNELGSVAQRIGDEGSEGVSEGTMVVKTSGKGKKRAKEQSPGIVGRAIPMPLPLASAHFYAGLAQKSITPATEESEDAKDALKSLDNYLNSKTKDPKAFRFKFRKQACEQVDFFPDASFTSLDVSKLVFESSAKQSLCEYHRKGKGSTFKADTVIELFGMGFKGASVSDASQVGEVQEGHLHCGCPTREVALEFFLWKTTRAFSSNPKLAGRSYAMEDLSKLKPSTRSFWNKSICDYTGLQVEDFMSPDYGSDEYAMRISLNQLHTQVECLKYLAAPVVVEVKFPEAEIGNMPADLLQYGVEAEWFGKVKQLEQYWLELKDKRHVFPLPLIVPTRV